MVSSLSELGYILGSGVKGKMELDHGGANSAQKPTHSETNEEPFKVESEMEWGMSYNYPSALSVRKTTPNLLC